MKTNQLIKRSFYQTMVTQRTSDKFFNATELLKYYNKNSAVKKDLKEFWSNQGTQDFLDALAADINLNGGISPDSKKALYLGKDLYTTKRGQNGGTYMHPYLFVKFAMWLAPVFEVQVIKWVYDNLIDFRNQAGDYYREMCSTIQERYVEFYKKKPDPLVFRKEACFLNLLVFGDERTRQRNEATEKQLDLMNRLQKANIKLIQANTPKTERQARLRDFCLLNT